MNPTNHINNKKVFKKFKVSIKILFIIHPIIMTNPLKKISESNKLVNKKRSNLLNILLLRPEDHHLLLTFPKLFNLLINQAQGWLNLL
jgi:hypothetical protein